MSLVYLCIWHQHAHEVRKNDVNMTLKVSVYWQGTNMYKFHSIRYMFVPLFRNYSEIIRQQNIVPLFRNYSEIIRQQNIIAAVQKIIKTTKYYPTSSNG